MMNRYDIEDATMLADQADLRTFQDAAGVIYRLAEWADHNSDGWTSWPAPSRASKGMQLLVTEQVRQYRQGHLVEDISRGDFLKALGPIKAFLTRQSSHPGRVTEVDRNYILGA